MQSCASSEIEEEDIALGPQNPAYDLDKAEQAIRSLLTAFHIDATQESIMDTPRRAAQAFCELLTNRPFKVTTFPNVHHYDELVIVRSIPFHSLCEHHLLPFYGHAHIGYLPENRIIGLSKLTRLVEHFSRRLQVQENLTAQIADWLQTNLKPKGAGVIIEAEHLCMSLRGVKASGTKTVTSALKGKLRNDPQTRQEFLQLVAKS